MDRRIIPPRLLFHTADELIHFENSFVMLNDYTTSGQLKRSDKGLRTPFFIQVKRESCLRKRKFSK